jgi:glycosyltransferase involved in cell wall biosynthesis
MRLAIVTHYFSTHRGGIELVAAQLAAALSTEHDVSWMASDCDDVPTDLPPTVRLVPMSSTNIVERIVGVPFPIWSPLAALRLWKELRGVDVVHLHDYAYSSNWLAFLMARMRGVPVLITQHIGFVPYKSRMLRLAQWLLESTIGRVMLGRADRVVFVSSVVRKYFQQRVHFTSRPRTIANGVDTVVFAPLSSPERLSLHQATTAESSLPRLLFVGRFVEKKGLAILEKLVERFPDVQWVFAGWGPLDPSSWGRSNVQVFSDLRGRSLAPLYQGADLLVLPSVGEGLPLVLQEAMSCGTPALVGEETAEAVGANSNVLFSCPVRASGAAEDWTRALRGILEKRRDLEAMRADVATFARTRWSWESCISAYDQTLRQLLARHAS